MEDFHSNALVQQPWMGPHMYTYSTSKLTKQRYCQLSLHHNDQIGPSLSLSLSLSLSHTHTHTPDFSLILLGEHKYNDHIQASYPIGFIKHPLFPWEILSRLSPLGSGLSQNRGKPGPPTFHLGSFDTNNSYYVQKCFEILKRKKNSRLAKFYLFIYLKRM